MMNTQNTPDVPATDEIDLGPRLRYMREMAGLSQRALAKKVGVQNSTISLIEAGKMNPSVGALKRVLEGIPVGLSEFFAFAPDLEREVFFAAEELQEIGKGKLSLKQVGGNLLGRNL